MKNILISIAILLLYGSMIAQSDSEPRISVVSEYTDGKVMLRWAPTTNNLWKKGNDYGYNIIRIQKAVGADPSVEEVLVTGLKPVPADEFDSKFNGENSAQAAKMMLYDNSMNTAAVTPENLREVVDKKEEEEGRYLFAMVAAESNYAVACAMGLGFEDTTFDPSKEYYYRIEINDETVMAELNPSLVSSSYEETPMVEIEGLSVEADHEVMVLTWDLREVYDLYSAWHIERSTDGVNFETINADPHLHAYTEEAFKYLGSYQDTDTENCNGHYYYRVKGITPFGTVGPASNMVQIECVPEPIVFPLNIRGVKEAANGLKVRWHNFDAQFENKIIGFNLYRTPDLTVPVTKINHNLLGKNKRSYTDTSPLQEAYYFLEAIDINGASHRSPEFFTQFFDHQAPDVVTGIVAKFTDEQELAISWFPSQESDIAGYHIWISNFENGDFTRRTKEIVTGTSHVIRFNESLRTEKVYIKMKASDIYFNDSEYSETIVIDRPDVWAPAKPVMRFAYPTDQGVALGWGYSGSEDAEKHILQRRPASSFEWKDIRIISNENQALYQADKDILVSGQKANHIDNYKLIPEAHYYRIIAMDEAGNKAYSSRIEVTPFSSRGLDVIKGFDIQIVKQIQDLHPDLLAQLENIGSQHLEAQKDKMRKVEYAALLSWSCELTQNLAGFTIYRSYTGQGFIPHAEIDISTAMGLAPGSFEVSGNQGSRQFSYKDDDLVKNRKYKYYLVGRYKNGQETGRSKVLIQVVN